MINRDSNQAFRSTSIAKNTVYNLFGYGIPVLFAIVTIPPLISGLGKERFGLLSIAWIVIGYFSFFDFGIGKALTKIISEKLSLNLKNQIPDIFWTSFSLMIIISLLLSFIFVFCAPFLVNNFLNISNDLKDESLKTFYILALAIPIVTTNTSLRGILEAYNRFAEINIIRSGLGISMFLIPLLVLLISNSLFWIVFSLVIIRIIIWFLYLYRCFNVNPQLRHKIKIGIDFAVLKPILRFSIWITIGNIIGPIILYSDRFIIGAMISAVAITYYVSPYEIATKLSLIPGALVGVLFPVFSGSYSTDPQLTKSILIRGVRFIFLVIFPAVFVLYALSNEIMYLWLGVEFAKNSSMVLKFISIGILMNSFSVMPNNFFQGIGKPKIPTIINLFELPIYLMTMWLSIKHYGINGAAFAFMVLASIDAFLMFFVAYKKFEINFERITVIFIGLSMAIGLITPIFISIPIFKLIFVILFLTLFVTISYKLFLTYEEQKFILSKFYVNK